MPPRYPFDRFAEALLSLGTLATSFSYHFIPRLSKRGYILA